MSFVNDQMDMMVGGSNDFPQRVLNESYVQEAPLAFAPTSGPKEKKFKQVVAEQKSSTDEIKEEIQNLNDRLDKIETDNTPAPKSKGVKGFLKTHRKKIQTGLLIGIALYAGYRLFLKDRLNFKFGSGGHTPEPMPSSVGMESGGEISDIDI